MSPARITLPLALVLTLGACSSGEAPNADGPPAGDGSSAITLVASGTTFDQTEIRAAAGSLEIRLDNQDAGTPHNIHVTGEGVDDKTEIESGPVVQTLTVQLSSGTYDFQCDVHPAQMNGTITVA